MFIHRLTFLNNSESSPTKASTAYLIPHLGFIIQRLYSLRRPTWDAEHELCRASLLSASSPPSLPTTSISSRSPFLSFPLSAALSHRTERLTDYCSNITTRYTSFPSISLSLSLTLALSVSLCFIGMTNNATFVYPKQPQVGYTAQSNIKEQWKIKKETSMKYTCNNKISKKWTFVLCQKKLLHFIQHMGLSSHKHYEMWITFSLHKMHF